MDCDDDNFIERINRSIVTEVLIKILISEFLSFFNLARCKNFIFPLSAYVLKLEFHLETEFHKNRTSRIDAVDRNVVERTW